MSDVNKELNSLPIHIKKSCPDCKRSYPETVLNIEGMIHHKSTARCIDRKGCERLKRKRLKK